MKEYKISEMETPGTVQGFYIIKSISVRKAKNGSFFADMKLSDKTGEINAKIWDASESAESQFASGSLVKARGDLSLWKGSLQFTIKKIRKATEEDGIDMEDFVQSAPESFESMYGELVSYIEGMVDQDLSRLTGYLLEKVKDKLSYYPAAKSNHHAIRCGLLYHTLTMLRVGEKVASVYEKIDKDLLYAGIIVHDLAKTLEMESDQMGIVSDYTREGKLLGHIIQGITDIEKAGEFLDIPKETVMLLKHMVLSHHYEPEFGSPRKPMIPEAELLHYLDMIDARMYDFFNNLDKTQDGEFSERVWTLDNRQIYKRAANKGGNNNEK
jgi:3'-5' exoribonuclease